MAIMAGTMASSRAARRRSPGGHRKSVKPYITICPATVPVIEEFWPDASNATA
jgi:hypothetical protein